MCVLYTLLGLMLCIFGLIVVTIFVWYYYQIIVKTIVLHLLYCHSKIPQLNVIKLATYKYEKVLFI